MATANPAGDRPEQPPPLGDCVAIACRSAGSVDFVHDQLANGRRFRVPNVIDDVTEECLVALPDTSISGKCVVREMRAVIDRRGPPGAIVGDNGTEFTSTAAPASTQELKLDWRYVAPHCLAGSCKA